MDGRGYAFTQDLFCLMVAVTATSLLLVNIASLHAQDSQRREIKELNDRARSICKNLLTYEEILYEGEHGILDVDKLDALDVDTLRGDLRIKDGFLVTMSSNAFGGSWAWSSSTHVQVRGVCVTSAAIHFDPTDVRPVRIVVWTWRI